MILAFEMTWTGTTHVPGNSAILQAVALAFPEQELRVFAAPSHLHELETDRQLAARRNVRFSPIAVSAHYRSKTHIVSVRRFLRELATLWSGLRGSPRGDTCLVILLSATPTAIFAASWMSRLHAGRTAVQVILHGNLNDITGWRPRNPLTRAFDLRSALAAHHPSWLRFVVLEPAIAEELAKEIPRAGRRTAVLPLPMNAAEFPEGPPLPLAAPLRIGYVGLATEAKGIGFFLDVATDFKARHGNRIEFHLVGSALRGTDLSRFAVLDNEVGHAHVPRADFVRQLASLHFVFLPYRKGYYERSASGALIDAITWLKPVIAIRLPLVERLYENAGDVGYLCDSDEEMRQALESVLAGMDRARYARQIEALRAVRAGRTPEALAERYRSTLAAAFGGVPPGDDG